MSKDTRKPSFTPAVISSGTAPEADAPVPSAHHSPRIARLKAGVESAVDVVTYPASLAMMLVLLPVASVANWWRE